MGAAKFVGRVGGLAVALGVGAATFAGTGVAWADTGSAHDSGSARSDSSGSASSGGSSRGSSARPAASRVASSAGAQSSSRSSVRPGGAPQRNLPTATAVAASSAVTPDLPAVDESSLADAVVSTTEESGAKGPDVEGSNKVAPKPVLSVARSLPLWVPTAATSAPAGAVSGFLSAVVSDLLDPSAGGNPTAPVDSPLSWALLGFTRREAGAAASAASPTASVTSSAIFGNSIVTNPNVLWVDGVLRGTVGATSTDGLPLTYKVIDAPSLGGKITFPPASTLNPTGNFSYLPDQSTLTNPSLNEQFSIRVTETTGFDTFLKGIPILGLFVQPVLDFLYQVPILNQLLAPIIGDSQVVQYDVNPSSLAAGRPVSFTYMMPSFDGTLISVNYFPSVDVANGVVSEAPTVLNGPGLGSPGNTNPDSLADGPLQGLVPGLVPLRTDSYGAYDGGGGYNVITWDPRGEFASGGILQLDSPFWEGRDTSSIIDWAISSSNPAQSQIKMESPGDPLLGMVGGSYGGGIQMAVAGTPDLRIDSIAPTITWNSLNEALYPRDVFKTAWSDILLLALVATGARINNQIYLGILTGNLFGVISETAQAVLAGSGSTMLVNNIDIPSLFVQGYTDGLFTLAQSVTNSQQIATANPLTPNKMVWVCQGHGACLDPQPSSQDQIANNLRWLDQYVAGTGTPADSIPNFTWYDQNGTAHASGLMPYDPGFNNAIPTQFQGAGGNLFIAPIIGGSGPGPNPPGAPTSFTIPTEARNALNVDVPLTTGTWIAGAPTLSFTYSGLGTNPAVYAQLVDNATGRVVGNMVTPIPVTMDGRQHTVDLSMENITYVAGPTDSMTLQITSSATAYENFTGWGLINISNINLSIPTVSHP